MTQQEHLQVFDLTLKVWGPLFVGSGKRYVKKDYLYNPNKGEVSFLDEQKFFAFLAERDLVEKYSQFMLSTESDLWKFLIKECGVPWAELKELQRYSVPSGDALDATHSLKEIYAFQRDAYGRAYIPGSSVKGALRTAWLLDRIQKDPSSGHWLKGGKYSSFPEERYVNQLRLRTQRDGSIASDAVNSLFRGIQIADSALIPDGCMILAGKKDFNPSGYAKPGNLLCRECVAPGTVIRFKLTLDQSVLKGRITKESLEAAIWQFDTYYQKTYGRHFTPPEKSALLPQQPYLILGGGAGFFSKSLAYPYLGEQEGLRWTANEMSRMFDKYGHNHAQDVAKGISPHTMKYARFRGKFYPYGYCGVTIA
ncbi:MAG: type III-A CRISPR-associated RAMP protein Csm5 [Faecalibacterium sp.]